MLISVSVVATRVLHHNLFASDISPSEQSRKLTAEITHSQSLYYLIYWYSVCMVTIFLNVVVVTAVNVAYVYLALTSGASVVTVSQIAVSIFKFVWNGVIVRSVLRYLLQKIKPVATDGQNQNARTTKTTISNTFVVIETAIVIFNNIISPYFSTLVISPVCFFSAFIAKVPVTSCSSGIVTASGVFECNGIATSSIPFSYLYECSSSYITTYASVFLFMFLQTAFISPILQLFMMYCHHHVPKNSNTAKLLCILQPKLLYPIPLLTSSFVALDNTATKLDHFVDKFYLYFIANKRVFQTDLYVVRLVNMIAILLTFGSVVPAVAVAGFVSVCSFTLYTECMLGRYALAVKPQQLSCEAEDSQTNIEELVHDCSKIEDMFKHSIYVILPYVSIFYSTLVFDALGDSVGIKAAMWAPLLIISISIALFVFKIVLTRYSTNKSSASIADKNVRENSRVAVGSNGVVSVPLEAVPVTNPLRMDSKDETNL